MRRYSLFSKMKITSRSLFRTSSSSSIATTARCCPLIWALFSINEGPYDYQLGVQDPSHDLWLWIHFFAIWLPDRICKIITGKQYIHCRSAGIQARDGNNHSTSIGNVCNSRRPIDTG